MKQEFGEKGGDTGRVSCWMVYGGGLDGAGLLNSTAWGQCGAVLARVLPIFMLSAIAVFSLLFTEMVLFMKTNSKKLNTKADEGKLKAPYAKSPGR